MIACYMVLIQHWAPHLALAPIAQADPPYMPFRDAGYSQADFVLNIQDVVYGVWKAMQEKLCVLSDFNLEEYVCFCGVPDPLLILLQVRKVRKSRYGGFQLGYSSISGVCITSASTYGPHSSVIAIVCYSTHECSRNQRRQDTYALQKCALTFHDSEHRPCRSPEFGTVLPVLFHCSWDKSYGHDIRRRNMSTSSSGTQVY